MGPAAKVSSPRGQWIARASLATSVLLFIAYFCFSSVLVSVSKKDVTSIPFNEHSQEPQTIFFHPLLPSPSFQASIKLRKGFDYIVDNDAEWLQDRLDTDERWGVIRTQVFLLSLVLLATGTLVFGMTLITWLPKSKPSEEQVNEALGSFSG
jgi:hypothetical protein